MNPPSRGERFAFAVPDHEEAGPADREVEIAARGESTLGEVRPGGFDQHAAAESLEEQLGGHVEAEFLASDRSLPGEGVVRLEAGGLRVGEVVGNHVLTVHLGREPRRRHPESVVHRGVSWPSPPTVAIESP